LLKIGEAIAASKWSYSQVLVNEGPLWSVTCSSMPSFVPLL